MPHHATKHRFLSLFPSVHIYETYDICEYMMRLIVKNCFDPEKVIEENRIFLSSLLDLVQTRTWHHESTLTYNQ